MFRTGPVNGVSNFCISLSRVVSMPFGLVTSILSVPSKSGWVDID